MHVSRYGLVNTGNWIGLGDLVEEKLGIAIDKGEQSSDWRKRPLTHDQIQVCATYLVHLVLVQRVIFQIYEHVLLCFIFGQYAFMDVAYLHELRDILLDELNAKGRLEWFNKESESRAERVSCICFPPSDCL